MKNLMVKHQALEQASVGFDQGRNENGCFHRTKGGLQVRKQLVDQMTEYKNK